MFPVSEAVKSDMTYIKNNGEQLNKKLRYSQKNTAVLKLCYSVIPLTVKSTSTVVHVEKSSKETACGE